VSAIEDAPSAWAGSQIVKVRHVTGGWRVSNRLIGETRLFGSRRQAEQRAGSLAGLIAKMGFDSRVDLHDETDTLIRTTWFWRDSEPESPPPRTGSSVGEDRPAA
jgi:hypothetical protein